VSGEQLAPEAVPYAYAVIRVVPRVERGECLNAGVILFCRPRRFLDARIHLDDGRLAALAPGFDASIARHLLERIPVICAGGKQSGPIGQLTQAERFNWLVAPASTVVQPGPVHTGLCADPEPVLERLFQRLVLPVGPPGAHGPG
jgi:hypothetical protein